MKLNEVETLEARIKAEYEKQLAAITLVKNLLSQTASDSVSPNNSAPEKHVTPESPSLFTEAVAPIRDYDRLSMVDLTIELIKRTTQGKDFTATDLMDIKNALHIRPEMPYNILSRTLFSIHSRKRLPGLSLERQSFGGGKGEKRGTTYKYVGSR